VKAITEALCGVKVSATQVSRATAQLDEVLQEWCERPLGEDQQRNPQTHERGWCFSKRGLLPQIGLRFAHGDQ